MRRKSIHRIYTESKNKRAILKLVAARFESFTMQPTLGYFKGRPEASIVLGIVGAADKEIEELAREIGEMNGQKSVLVMRTSGKMRVTRR